MRESSPPAPVVIGQYEVHDLLGAGGMATVHLGRKRGPAGFTKLVAIKRLHPQLAHDEEFVTMFLDEARLAARINHPHVVETLDVQVEDGEFLLALEYVHGEPLHVLAAEARKRGETVPVSVAARIAVDLLEGLHAAHEATGERGAPLGIVHRDVSPHNVLVGVDGSARVLDFGIAKASERAHVTLDGKVKGKLRYMSPEQLAGEPVDRRTDVYATGVVLWELLTGERFFASTEPSSLIGLIASRRPPLPSSLAGERVSVLDEVVARALEKARDARFETAQAMGEAIERALPLAPRSEVSAWVARLAGPSLTAREDTRRRVAATALEATATITGPRGEMQSSATDVRERGRPSDLPTSVDPQGTGSLTSSESDAHPPRRGSPAWFAGVTALLGAAVAALWLIDLRTAPPAAPAMAATVSTSPGTPPLPVAAPSEIPPAASTPPPSSAAAPPPPVRPTPPRHRSAPPAVAPPPASAPHPSPSADTSAKPLPRPVLDSNGLMQEGR